MYPSLGAVLQSRSNLYASHRGLADERLAWMLFDSIDIFLQGRLVGQVQEATLSELGIRRRAGRLQGNGKLHDEGMPTLVLCTMGALQLLLQQEGKCWGRMALEIAGLADCAWILQQVHQRIMLALWQVEHWALVNTLAQPPLSVLAGPEPSSLPFAAMLDGVRVHEVNMTIAAGIELRLLAEFVVAAGT